MYNLIEFLIWGRKSRTYKRLMSGKTRSRKQSRLVLNERAQLRLAGKLLSELPQDVAVAVLNDVKRYGVEA